MKTGKRTDRKAGRTGLLSVMLIAGALFLGTALIGGPAAADSQLSKQIPAIVLTGTDIITDGYTPENVSEERSFTLEELQKTESVTNLYSTCNNYGTRKVYRGEGIPLRRILSWAGLQAGYNNRLQVIALDGYTATFDPGRTDINTPQEPGSGAAVTQGLLAPRYYYHGEEETPVETIIAWAEQSSAGQDSIPGEVEKPEAPCVRLMTGQLARDDVNNNMFNGKLDENGTRTLIICCGDEVDETILSIVKTIRTEGSDEAKITKAQYTRAGLLAREYAEKEYSFGSRQGDGSILVKGIPAAALLADRDLTDQAEVSFVKTDGSEALENPVTRKQLTDGNYILAYEEKSRADEGWQGICDTLGQAPDRQSFLTIYGDNIGPIRGIREIEVTDTKEAQVDPKPSEDIDEITPTSAAADKAAVDSSLLKQIPTSSITDGANLKAGNLNIGFGAVKNAVNYRIAWREAGAADWTHAWTGGKNNYTLRGLTVKGLYEFKLIPYARMKGTWVRGKDSPLMRVYFASVSSPKAKAGKRKCAVSWKADKSASGYQVLYSLKKNMRTGVKVRTVSGGKKKTATVKKLKKGRKYYFQIQPYKTKNGNKYIGFPSKKLAKKIK
ncbi:MAG: fibronectin type III domain-containing protein [Firmicutes bacterium]|nr:fibronectin type III domain-containing protein [Bacillota bacterium]